MVISCNGLYPVCLVVYVWQPGVLKPECKGRRCEFEFYCKTKPLTANAFRGILSVALKKISDSVGRWLAVRIPGSIPGPNVHLLTWKSLFSALARGT